jgi:hypothetical protein
MRISKKAVMRTMVAGSLTLGMLSMSGQAEANYDVTFYVAGMGGHFAKAEISIDPSNAEPFRLKKLEKVDIGTKATHPVHDARIDHSSNQMYWSTYKEDKSENLANLSVAHVGVTDLKTGEVAKDMLVTVPEAASQKGSLYCASGQSKDYFIPISMANKGYIDVIQKSDLKMVQRVFLEGTDADIQKPYKFYHGTTSPDSKKLLVTINEAETNHGTLVGKMHLIELDLESLIKGEVKVLNKGLATGTGTFVSFRQYYSADGSMIANSAGGAMLLIDAKNLNVIDSEPMPNLTENHDAIFTPDGKYVIATQRTKAVTADCKNPEKPGPDEYLMDGELRLYDVSAKQFVGKAVSVCAACHQVEGVEEHAVLCGLDAAWH